MSLAACIWALSLTQLAHARSPAEQVCKVWSVQRCLRCWCRAREIVACCSLCPTPELLEDFPWPCHVQAAGAPRRCTPEWQRCTGRGYLTLGGWEGFLLEGPGPFHPSLGQTMTVASHPFLACWCSIFCSAGEWEWLGIPSYPQPTVAHGGHGHRAGGPLSNMPGQLGGGQLCDAMPPSILLHLHPAVS